MTTQSASIQAHRGLGIQSVRLMLKRIGYALFFLFVLFSCIAIIEPSPYDFVAIPCILLWMMLGIRLHRAVIPFVALLFLFKLGIFLSLVPYFNESNSVVWTLQSGYLMVTGLFFVMFFSDETEYRIELSLQAYAISCVVAAAAGIVGYFDIFGTEKVLSHFGRASGTFQDPNVLGSFLILGAITLIHNLLLGRARHPLVSLLSLSVILGGVFLSFSRGSWGALIIAVLLMVGSTFATTRSRWIKRRIVRLALLTFLGGAVTIGGLLSIPEVAETFSDRAQVTKDYDEGETGRFGNQLRSLPMLLDRPQGLGPLRFRLWFNLEPHNSYIGGFANGGWLGGFSFIGLVLVTCFVGFRLCWTPSPYRRLAQILWPALFVFFLQGFQIDIDHWRHVYMMLGGVWALEAARMRWMADASLPAPSRASEAP